MRHKNKNKKFNRKSGQRKALMSSLARSLVLFGGINTTETKAKALRPYIEKLVTKSRDASRQTVTQLHSTIGDDAARQMLENIAPKYTERPGGYTRIIKLPTRPSSAARMARIEFVE